MDDLTKGEVLKVLTKAKAKRARDYTMILMAFCHGLRPSEVVAIKRDQIADGYLRVQRLKGSKKTTQQLLEHANPLLNERQAVFEYVAKMTGNQRLFKITSKHFWRLFRGYALEAGIAKHKRHPHVLKHSIAMQTIGKAGIEHVRQWLGHKSMSSTGAYLKVSDEQAGKRIQKALKL